jgi:hypothetical protein
MNNLANTLMSAGHYPDAEQLLRSTLEIKRRVLGPDHPSTLTTMTALNTSLMHQSRYGDAEKMQRETLGVQSRVLGPEHSSTLMTRSLLAVSLLQQRERDPAEALRLLHEAVTHGLSPSDCLGLEKDPDLSALHGDPLFDAVVADARNRAKRAP